MAAVSAGLAAALVIGATAGVTAVSMRSQQIASNKAETRAKGIAENERQRQSKQDSLLRAQESEQARRSAGALKATTGGRGGRRSLISNGSPSDLGQQTTLG